MTVHGHVRNGVIVLDTPQPLPEGAAVLVSFSNTESETTPQNDLPILRHAGTLRLGPDASRKVDDVLYGASDA